MANTTAAGVAAATLDRPSAYLLLTWGAVLGGLEIITGVLGYIQQKDIFSHQQKLAELQHEREKLGLELKYRDAELSRMHETLRMNRPRTSERNEGT